MQASEFTRKFMGLVEQYKPPSSSPVVVRIEGFTPMQVTNVHPEVHEDDGSITIWITAEEM